MSTARILKHSLLAAAATFLISSAIFADTLELKNGQTYEGQYSGGTDTVIRFVINGETRVFQRDEVKALNLTTGSKNSPSTTPPPNAPADPETAPPSGTPPDSNVTPPAPAPPASVPPDSNPPATMPPPPDQDTNPPAASAPPTIDAPGNGQTSPPSISPSTPPDATAPNAPTPPGNPPAMAPQFGGSATAPVDTPITVRMIDSIDSRYDQPGKRFHASLEKDLLVNGVVVAPKGTDVYGRLIYASQAGHIQGRAELRLEVTTLMINGHPRPIATGEYYLAGKSRGKQSGERIGGAAIGGAIIGGIIGGGEGAAAGAAIGAGAGTAVQLSTEGDHVKIPSETLLEFKLSAPFTAVPAQPPVR